MRKIANILTKNLFTDNIFYNVVDDKSLLIKDLPVLCVGIELTKKNYPEFNRLSMDVDADKDIYWTYGPREKRNVYEDRLKEFVGKVVEKLVKTVKYEYVNIITEGLCSDKILYINNLIHNKQKEIISFINNGLVYIYDSYKTVYGISLREIQYIGENVKLFLSNIYSNTTVITNKDSIPLNIRTLFIGKNYLIPCLYSNNKENQ